MHIYLRMISYMEYNVTGQKMYCKTVYFHSGTHVREYTKSKEKIENTNIPREIPHDKNIKQNKTQ